MSDPVLIALVQGLVAIFVAACGVAMLWLKMREATEKIDQNTAITRAGTQAAAVNAHTAATAATNAAATAESIERKLNGGTESLVLATMAPLRDTLAEHAAQDERNLEEINLRFREVTEYIHRRNHDLLDAIHGLSLKVDVAMLRQTITATVPAPTTPAPPTNTLGSEISDAIEGKK